MARLSVECYKISQPFLSTKRLILQLQYAQEPVFHFVLAKFNLIAMPNADYQEIDLKAPQTNNNNTLFNHVSPRS